MTPEDKKQLRPSDESFPYTLIVSDHHNRETDGDSYYPRHGWASLSYHEPDKPVCDANPLTEEYIQEQTTTREEIVENNSLGKPTPVAGETIQTHQLTDAELVGWKESPKRLWEFIETIRDEYYEAGLEDPSQLPVRVVTTGPTDTQYGEVYEIYLRDPEGGEYIMWNSDEFWYEDDSVNSLLIQKVLSAVANAYEEPNKFLDNWGTRRTQVETCDPV